MAMSMYYKEMEKIPLLTLEEEKSLATKAFSGDKEAQNKLVEANLRFVVKVANQYQGYMDIEDLINEGNLGLMHAAKKYNPDNGTKFCTYAVWWIRSYIQKAIRETSTGVKFPSTKYNEMKKDIWNFVSLEKPVKGKDDNDMTFGNLIEDEFELTPEESFIEDYTKQMVSCYVDLLDDKHRTVIVKRFGLDGNKPMSLSEIGLELGYSKERIRQIESKAMMILRNMASDLAA